MTLKVKVGIAVACLASSSSSYRIITISLLARYFNTDGVRILNTVIPLVKALYQNQFMNTIPGN